MSSVDSRLSLMYKRACQQFGAAWSYDSVSFIGLSALSFWTHSCHMTWLFWVWDVILLDSSFPSMIMKVLSRRLGFTLCHMWTDLCHWCISVLSSGLDAACSYDMVTCRLRALSFWTHSCRMTGLFGFVFVGYRLRVLSFWTYSCLCDLSCWFWYFFFFVFVFCFCFCFGWGLF